MVTITIGNSYSSISGLNVYQDKALRQLLSYTVGGSSSYFSKYGPRKASLLSKRGEFPTGLIHRVYLFLNGSKIQFTENDTRVVPILTKGIMPKANITPYDWQIEATAASMTWKRGIISATTGSGKSLVISMVASVIGRKTLVVVPTLEIKRQLTENIKDFFGSADWIDVENIDSAALIFKPAVPYDVLIIDEGHHSAAKTYRKLNKTAWNDIYYRFFFTATPFRNDDEEQILFESIAGQVIYELTYQEAIAEEYIVPVHGFYVDLPKKETDAYTYAQVYSELVVNNKERNVIVANLLERLEYVKGATLCLVREVRHGEILSEMTGIPFVNGADEDSRKYIQKFNCGDIKMLIGTEGVIGEGVDTKPCEYVVIAGLGKAKSALMQKIGRCVRNYPGKEYGKVIIFKDKSHKYLLRHFNAQKKILVDIYDSKPVKLEL